MSFSWVKQRGHGVDHPPPSSAKVKGRIELYLYSPSGPSWPVLYLFTFTSEKRDLSVLISVHIKCSNTKAKVNVACRINIADPFQNRLQYRVAIRPGFPERVPVL